MAAWRWASFPRARSVSPGLKRLDHLVVVDLTSTQHQSVEKLVAFLYLTVYPQFQLACAESPQPIHPSRSRSAERGCFQSYSSGLCIGVETK